MKGVEEILFEEITIYGERDLLALDKLSWDFFTERGMDFTDKFVWKQVNSAIEEAIRFYEDEAGGAHDMTVAKSARSSQEKLDALPN